MSFCPNCGTPTAATQGHAPQQVQPPPVYSVPAQFAQGPYPVPGPYPYPYPYYPYQRSDPRQVAASAGCTLMIFDGALAILFSLILFISASLIGLFLMAAAIVAIVGGWLGMKGIMPLVAAAGPPLLIIAALMLLTIDPFMIIISLIGMVLAGISLALVVYGWSYMVQKAQMRKRGPRGHQYPYGP